MKQLFSKHSSGNLRARVMGILAALLAIFLSFQMALANLSPQYLKNGRTYDQETAYFQWTGSVGYLRLFHRDNTSLPASEGGASCASGCTETITRISNGGSVSGNFTYLQSFSVQVAYSGNPGVGTAVIRACGQVIRTVNLYQAGAGTPGFNNFPSPAWNVPTAGDCTWSITATGGYVDFRAVTTTFRSTPAPTLDLKVNGTDGPLQVAAPGSYTLGWTSHNAAACTASGDWSGAQATNGTQAYSNIASGSYTYTLTCTNPSGSVSESVTVDVTGAPTVSISAPDILTAPASYPASWASTDAVSCSGSDRFSGLTGLSGSTSESNLGVGVYDYTVTCVNAEGVSASDTRRTTVVAAPTVDVKVNGLDGPDVILSGPISYTASWTSTHATQCTGSARLAGFSGMSGDRGESDVPVGTSYTYTMTCQNAAGELARDSVTVTVVDQLSGTTSAAWVRLLFFAPHLGQPAQTLSGSVSGGIPPYAVIVWVRPPSGALISFPRSGPTWWVTPDNAGDLNFGTTEEGLWTAWAELQDSSGQTYRTNSVVWEVVWHPVHGRP